MLFVPKFIQIKSNLPLTKRAFKKVRRYTEIRELTYENVLEFIDRIGVCKLDKNTLSVYIVLCGLPAFLWTGRFSASCPLISVEIRGFSSYLITIRFANFALCFAPFLDPYGKMSGKGWNALERILSADF